MAFKFKIIIWTPSSQVADEILYTGLIEMQELWRGGGERTGPAYHTESSLTHLCLQDHSVVSVFTIWIVGGMYSEI